MQIAFHTGYFANKQLDYLRPLDLNSLKKKTKNLPPRSHLMRTVPSLDWSLLGTQTSVFNESDSFRVAPSIMKSLMDHSVPEV